jgi:uncharacterized protein
MIKRQLTNKLKELATKYPVVSVVGPRQSGKSTLAKTVFPDYKYISLEDLDYRENAERDPRGFLEIYNNKIIFDEIQHVPSLFSYLQTHVDKNNSTQFILTGSQQFTLNAKISQTLTGRTAILRLLPFSLAELLQRKSQTCWHEGKIINNEMPLDKLNKYLFSGFYPRIYDKKLDPLQFMRDYVDTYVTKDLRDLTNIENLSKFKNFLRLLAARSGQRINLTSLGNDSGVSHTTISNWLSILEASFIIHILPPHFKNFNKRIVKTPKLYFLDTALLCYLLKIQSLDDLNYHPYIGQIFETFIFSELYKTFSHRNEEISLYFWQDQSGNEVDFIVDLGKKLLPIEVKSGKTINSDFLKNLNYWLDLQDDPEQKGYLIYGGNERQKRHNVEILPWYDVS